MKLTDEQVLKRCVEIAVENGWKLLDEGGKETQISTTLGYFRSSCGCYPIIFSHPFAKALWGDVMVTTNLFWLTDTGHRNEYHLPNWQHHLQQMVLAENPIDYLREWLASKEEKNG